MDRVLRSRSLASVDANGHAGVKGTPGRIVKSTRPRSKKIKIEEDSAGHTLDKVSRYFIKKEDEDQQVNKIIEEHLKVEIKQEDLGLIPKLETVIPKLEEIPNSFEPNPLQVFNHKDNKELLVNVFKPVQLDDIEDIPSSIAQPKNWLEIYNRVVKMRALFVAPVDTMGCERIPEQINSNIRENPKLFRYQLLISLMLSSQTKDEVNYEAVLRMNQSFIVNGYRDGLCIEAILNTSEVDIDRLIQKVGFHNKKAIYIKRSSELLRDNFNGDIPKTIQEIVTLPGVGPKMGYLLLHKAWNIADGIGVDVHLHRLAQMWKWAPKSDKPEVSRVALQKWLPKKFWSEVNPLLVGFGQMVCLPKGNKCDVCSLATAGLCPSVNRKLLNQRGSPDRLAQLHKGRGDLSLLIEEIGKLA